jgi:hypothetical protein
MHHGPLANGQLQVCCAEQLPDTHCEPEWHGAPFAPLVHTPGSAPAGSAQRLLAQCSGASHVSPFSPAEQVPRTHARTEQSAVVEQGAPAEPSVQT